MQLDSTLEHAAVASAVQPGTELRVWSVSLERPLSSREGTELRAWWNPHKPFRVRPYATQLHTEQGLVCEGISAQQSQVRCTCINIAAGAQTDALRSARCLAQAVRKHPVHQDVRQVPFILS